eukprot:Gb_17952 [translate_table: standard]
MMKRRSGQTKEDETVKEEFNEAKHVEFEGILIAGGGIAGLATALALHRVGLKSLVLERADGLRATGTVISIWNNAWKALDALGIGDKLRQHYLQLQGAQMVSTVAGTKEYSCEIDGKRCHEFRCVKRSALLEAMAGALPPESIRINSKIVRLQQKPKSKFSSIVELEDGTVIRAKAVIGCDGVNSVVADWLGLSPPIPSGRCGIRGYAIYPEGHHVEPKYSLYFGKGVNIGHVPINETEVYWFITRASSPQDSKIAHDPELIRQETLFLLRDFPEMLTEIVQRSGSDTMSMTALRHRLPWRMFFGTRMWKGTVTAVGDGMHPMTPDLGQGGCAALEDAVVLGRCLAEALNGRIERDEEEAERIEEALKKYVDERRWRWTWLMVKSYFTGFVRQGSWAIVRLFRDKIFLRVISSDSYFSHAEFDCGRLPL